MASDDIEYLTVKGCADYHAMMYSLLLVKCDPK